jgi:LPXTG-motif cell wall-anchored protein
MTYIIYKTTNQILHINVSRRIPPPGGIQMKKTLSIILTLVLAISIISNYQVSFAAPEEEKDNKSDTQHLKDENKPSNGNNPKYDDVDDILIEYQGKEVDQPYEVQISKPGSDKTKVILEKDEFGNYNVSEGMKVLDEKDTKNNGGVYKIEIIDESGKVKSKNFKINESKEIEVIDEIPEGTTPEGTTPEGTTPGGSTPGGSTPGGSTPGGSTPEGSTPEGSTPEGSTLEGSTLEDSSHTANTGTDLDNGLAAGGASVAIFDTVIVPVSTELTPEGIPTVEIKEDVPAAAPAAPATQNTLPKTGDASSLVVSGLGAALVAFGLMINRRKISK